MTISEPQTVAFDAYEILADVPAFALLDESIRGLVAEYGLVATKEMSSLRSAIPGWLEDADNGLSASFRYLLEGLWRDLRSADERILELDGQINEAAKADPAARRLQQLRGVGPVVATALVACVAMANKTARMAWAMLRHGTNYQPALAAA